MFAICGTSTAAEDSQDQTTLSTYNNDNSIPDPYIQGKPGNYTKIQDAIDAATTDDVIIVESGNYNENVFFNKRITLKTNGTINVESNNSNLPTFTIETMGTGSTIEGNLNINSLIVKGGSTLNIAGGTIIYAKNLTVTENSQIICQGNNTNSQINGEWKGTGVTFIIGNLTIDTGSKLTADNQGYNNATGAGPGAPTSNTKAGGSYGGYGGTINHVGDTTNAAEPYGDVFNPTDLGSTGGYGEAHNRNAGIGGGAIIITVEKLILNGSISANGQSRTNYETGGAGSGGSVNINTNQLSGSGAITANGGNAWNDWLAGSGGGSGGRILIKYNTSDFTGTITANGGTGKQYTSLYGDYTINGNGEKGSVVYTPTDHLIINYDLVFPKDSTINLNYNQVTVQNGANVTIGGGSTVNILGKLIVTENSQIICQSKNTDSQVNSEWVGVGVTINADDLTIDSGSKITADNQGYTPYNGPGAKGRNSDQGNSGGTHAGIGANGNQWGAANTNTYGNPYKPTELGSGGGDFDYLGGGSGGSGGGAVKINVANNLQVDGSITANGENKNTGRGDGAGAGGSIYILTRNLAGSGTITAKGGNSISNRGGGGGGGRIAIYYEESTYTGTTSVNGGTGGKTTSPAAETGTVRLVKSAAASLLNSNLVETSSNQKTWTDTIISKTATITGIPATGKLNGTLDITNLELVQIACDPLKNSGFFKGNWNATLDNIQYQGNINGMFYPQDGLILFKGTLSGDIIGTIEAQLTKNETEYVNYNKFSGTWKLSTFSDNPISDILTLYTTTVTYSGETQYPNTQLTLLQTHIKGTATGQYNGQLNTVLNHLVVSDTNSPYYSEGFSTLSYTSTEGSGSGWTYDQITEPQKTELVGLFNGPLSGIITGLLDESTTPRTLNLRIGKTDAGLPAMADMEVQTSGPGKVVPGETINYVIEYWNKGVAKAENVTIYDYLSIFVDYISNTGNGIYDANSHTVKFQLGTLIPGQKGTISIKVKVQWGLGLGWNVNNNAVIGTDSLEIDNYLNPDWALTPEQLQNMVAYARWSANAVPPNYDPTASDWQGITPTTPNDRIQEAIQIINEVDPQMGKILQNLYNEGKISIDDTAFSSECNINGLVIQASLLGIPDANGNLGVSDSKWQQQALVSALMSTMIHEGDHSQQWGDGILPAMPNGELRSYLRESVSLAKLMDIYIDQGDLERAVRVGEYLQSRWQDFIERIQQGYATDIYLKLTPGLLEYAKAQKAMIQDVVLEYYRTTPPSKDSFKAKKIALENFLIMTLSFVPGMDPNFNFGIFQSVTINAHDPNIKYGPEGYVLPGDTLNYKVEFENVGEGTAYGVYFTDSLDEDMDTSTLQIGPVKSTVDDSIIAPAGVYDSATRTITWQVGEVGPQEGGYAEYSVKLRSDATDGTSVINYAIVYFPSVPEETRTNAIVSIVDLTPPTVTITNPTNGANIRGTNVVTATATDTNPVAHVVFEIKNSNYIVIATGTDTNGTDGWSYNWDPTNLTTGDYTITTTAYDAAGNIGTNQITVQILADVYATTTFSTTTLIVGENIVATVKIGNNGPGKGTDIVLTYVLPEGMELVDIRTDPANQGTINYSAASRTITWTIGDVLVGDPYLYVTQRPVQAGVFSSAFSLSSTSTRGLTNINMVSRFVTVTPQRTPDNGSSNSQASTVNAASTSSTTQTGDNTNTIPMQPTGLPVGAAIIAALMIASGLFNTKREK